LRQTLETQRLALRELEPDDVDRLAEVLSDPVSMRYYPAPFDRDGVVAWIDRVRERYAKHGFGLWAVTVGARSRG
jgi:RimJ/RimL family protein N-acetyltransferase